MNIGYNHIEVLRHDLKILANELDAGRDLRVAAASAVLTDHPAVIADLSLIEAAYEVRNMVADAVGYHVADQDEDEDDDEDFGIPTFESFVCLSRVYGPNWARLAFADYLAHLSHTPIREPQAVASAVLNRAASKLEEAELLAA